MIQQTYIVVFTLTGAICLLGVSAVRDLDNPDVRRSLAGLLVFTGVWSLLTAAQVAASSQSRAAAIHTVALVAGIATVFAWLAFSSAYAGRQYHRRRSLQVSGVLIFLAIISVKLTNSVHGMYFSTSVATEPFLHTTISYHAIHWFVTGFSYTGAAVGFLWLFDSFDQASRVTPGSDSGTSSERNRPTTLYALVFVTALPIVPYGLSSYSRLLVQINYEPLGVAAFTLGVLFYARTEFTRHSSPGQSTLVDELSDGGLVLDGSDIVINYNERAAEILGVSSIPRVPMREVDPDLASLETGDRARVTYEVSGHRRTYEVERSPAEESLIASDILTLKDVTRATRLEQLTAIHREISQALVNTTDPWEFIQDVPDRFASIDAYELVWLYRIPDDDRRTVPPESPGGFADGTDLFRDGSRAVVGDGSGTARSYAEWVVSNADWNEPVVTAANSFESYQLEPDGTDEEWGSRLAEHGVTDCLAVPMPFEEQQSCVLGVYTTDPTGFDDPERKLIEEICRRIPEAVERIETHQEALQYREAITHAGTAVFITDTEGTIQYVNPAFERLTSYSAEEAVGKTPRILKSGEMTEKHYQKLWGTILSGEVFEERTINKTKDGDRYIAQQTIAPVVDEEGDPVAFVAVQFEITDKILREQRLSVLNRVLRHNLRTELNVISGHATLLEDRLGDGSEELPAEIRESLERIRTHADELAAQSETAREIEQVLSATQTGRVCVPAAELAESAEATADSLGGDCTVTVEDDATEWQVDAELKQVVDELVENAFVHHDEEPADVDVSVRLERDERELLLTVADDGPGMSEQELVFLEEGGEDPLRHGSGLELWMVNWLVMSLGGSIAVSTGEEGTTIRVTVPLRGKLDPGEPPAEVATSR